MTAISLRKVTSVPAIANVVAGDWYLVTDSVNNDYFELYIAANDGNSMRRVPTTADIEAMINSALGASGQVTFADNITARDGLATSNGLEVFVIDATSDPTVASGAAKYIWRDSTSEWIKISEAESQDLAVTWASITDGPTSTPAQIDNAVSAVHSHSNKTELDKISQGADGQLNYDGAPIKSFFTQTDW